MKLISYGKINLFLNIVGKRKDNYHNIETLIQRVDLMDELELHVDKTYKGIEVNITCNKPYVPLDNKNLCYKACNWFMEKYNLQGRVNIHINKNIPISAGLGGGTSNGAEIIKALNNIYDLNISISKLSQDSVVLGADFPYCITGGTVLCEGIGEKLTNVKSFSNNVIVIVKPDFGFDTKSVYENFNIENIKYNANKNNMIDCLNKEDFYGVCNNICNVLELSSVQGMDTIKYIKSELIKLGAINSSMSGSGSSVYGIFNNLYVAQKSYDYLKKYYNEVYITRTINL